MITCYMLIFSPEVAIADKTQVGRIFDHFEENRDIVIVLIIFTVCGICRIPVAADTGREIGNPSVVLQ